MHSNVLWQPSYATLKLLEEIRKKIPFTSLSFRHFLLIPHFHLHFLLPLYYLICSPLPFPFFPSSFSSSTVFIFSASYLTFFFFIFILISLVDGGAELDEYTELGKHIIQRFPLHMYARLSDIRHSWVTFWKMDKVCWMRICYHWFRMICLRIHTSTFHIDILSSSVILCQYFILSVW